MNKGFKRMQVYLDPKKRLLIKIFDHFKMAVKIRKILRYWVNFSNNRVQWVKADMQEAFRKWAQGDSQRAMDLDRKNYAYLQEKNMKQSQVLINIAEKEHYNDAMIKHLSLQRDELLQHYIRGQRLGLSMCRENHIKGKGKYFNVWKAIFIEAKKVESTSRLRLEVERMTAAKEKKRQIEEENLTLANENDELRQFSMDGFKIAQNVTSLSAERETLTIDLADQEDMIQKLLKQKEELEAALSVY